jgi:hypothetical protein
MRFWLLQEANFSSIPILPPTQKHHPLQNIMPSTEYPYLSYDAFNKEQVLEYEYQNQHVKRKE